MVSVAGTGLLYFQSLHQDTCIVRVKGPLGAAVTPDQKLLSLGWADIWSQFIFVVWGCPVRCRTFSGFPGLRLVCDNQQCLRALPGTAWGTGSPLIKDRCSVCVNFDFFFFFSRATFMVRPLPNRMASLCGQGGPLGAHLLCARPRPDALSMSTR